VINAVRTIAPQRVTRFSSTDFAITRHKLVRCGNSADKAKDVRLLGTCRKPDVAIQMLQIQVLHIPALRIPSALQIPQQAAVDHAAFRVRRSHAKKNSPKPPK
jgi:hypothetical protein